jgi:hypothetical protein
MPDEQQRQRQHRHEMQHLDPCETGTQRAGVHPDGHHAEVVQRAVIRRVGDQKLLRRFAGDVLEDGDSFVNRVRHAPERQGEQHEHWSEGGERRHGPFHSF